MAIRLAVVGCGAIARQSHIPNLLRNASFKLIALVDPVVSVAKGIKNEFGLDVNCYNRIDILPACDAAIVSVPPHLHASITISLLKRGINVLCEKPMATNYNDARNMMKTAEELKKVLLIGMTKQYCLNTAIMKDFLKNAFLGSIESYELLSGTRSHWGAANPKRYDPKYVLGGVVFENGVHWIYRLLYWFGYPKIIRYEDDRINGVEANAFIECSHRREHKEIKGTMTFSADHVLANKLTVIGTNRTAIIFENDEDAIYVSKIISDHERIFRVQESLERFSHDLFQLELNDFASVIMHSRKPKVVIEKAVESIRFIEEAYAIRKNIYQPWVYQTKVSRGDKYGH